MFFTDDGHRKRLVEALARLVPKADPRREALLYVMTRNAELWKRFKQGNNRYFNLSLEWFDGEGLPDPQQVVTALAFCLHNDGNFQISRLARIHGADLELAMTAIQVRREGLPRV